jgi:hypothetical protein
MTIENEQTIVPEVQQEQVEQPVVENTETEVTESAETAKLDDLINPDDSKNVAKRIGKLSKKLSEKEQEIEYWRQQAMAKNESVQPAVVDVVEPSGKPHAADFATNEEFIEALTEWKIEQREAAIAETRKQNDLKNAYFERVEAFKQSAPDFTIAVSEVQDIIGRDSNMVDFILDSDVGPAIAYHLANNEAELNRIMSMSPVRRIAALSRIETEFNTRKPIAKDRPVQQPASRLTSNTGSAVPSAGNVKPENGDYSAWKKWREQNRRK